MPIKKSNTLGVITFEGKLLQAMMVSHPKKPGSFILGKPTSRIVREAITEKVSELIGLQIKTTKWFMRSSGIDHKMLYLTCPHKNFIMVSVEDGKSHSPERRNFTVGSQCIGCKRWQKSFQQEEEQEEIVEVIEYNYPQSVTRTARRSSVTRAAVLNMPKKFNETFAEICDSGYSSSDIFFEQDMLQIERNELILQKKIEKESREIKKILKRLNSRDNDECYDDDDVEMQNSTETALEMECHPQEYEIFQPWLH